MASLTIKGNPKWRDGIPPDTDCKIEVLPARLPVFNQKVTRQVTVELDPGIYHILLQKFLGKNANNRNSMLKWEQTIFHDITKAEYEVLINMVPTDHRSGMTSEGFFFYCNQPGCGARHNNTIAALLHECEHKNVSRKELVENSDNFIAENIEAATDAQLNPKRGPGRPPKPNYTS